MDGTIRFKRNHIVRALVDRAGMNDIAREFLHSHPEDYTQLMQLIGYSVGGFGELSSSPPDTVAAADAIAEQLSQRAHTIDITLALDGNGAPIEAMSGRMRYRVVCTACNVLIHEATTGPDAMAKAHIGDGAAYERPMDVAP